VLGIIGRIAQNAIDRAVPRAAAPRADAKGE